MNTIKYAEKSYKLEKVSEPITVLPKLLSLFRMERKVLIQPKVIDVPEHILKTDIEGVKREKGTYAVKFSGLKEPKLLTELDIYTFQGGLFFKF